MAAQEACTCGLWHKARSTAAASDSVVGAPVAAQSIAVVSPGKGSSDSSLPGRDRSGSTSKYGYSGEDNVFRCAPSAEGAGRTSDDESPCAKDFSTEIARTQASKTRPAKHARLTLMEALLGVLHQRRKDVLNDSSLSRSDICRRRHAWRHTHDVTIDIERRSIESDLH